MHLTKSTYSFCITKIWGDILLYFHDMLLKCLVVDDGFVLHPCLVSIDGVDRIVEEMSDAF